MMTSSSERDLVSSRVILTAGNRSVRRHYAAAVDSATLLRPCLHQISSLDGSVPRWPLRETSSLGFAGNYRHETSALDGR